MTQTILITGGTSGIGRSAALAFAARGASVAVAGRREAEGRRVVEEVERAGGRGLYVAMDVSRPGEIAAGVAQAAAALGGFDAVIANAGREQPHTLPLAELEDDEIGMILDTNVRGVLLTARHAIPRLKTPGGTLILVSSLWAHQGGAGLSAYTASKGAVEALTRALAVELGPQGLRANCISPGVIDTAMSRRFMGKADFTGFFRANIPLQRIGQPEEIAQAMLWLASPAASYVTGQVIGVDGGMPIKMSVAQG